MSEKKIKKISYNIANKLIKACKSKKKHDKNIVELFNDIATEEEKKYSSEILVYVIHYLSEKGYEIVDGSHSVIEKY